MHAEVIHFLNRCRRHVIVVEGEESVRDWEVVEIGARNINGRAQDAFGMSYYWLNTDIEDGHGIEIVGPGAEVLRSLKGNAFDAVVSCEVFEHTDTWRAIVTEAAGAVKSCGWLIVTCAATGRSPHSAVHGGPLEPGEYYGNVDPDEFRVVADSEGWHVELWEYDEVRGDLFALLRHCA